jgi:hypothetical protein
MVAICEFDDPQMTDCNGDVLPSLNVPVAMNGWLSPTPMDPLTGVTVIEARPDGVRLLG